MCVRVCVLPPLTIKIIHYRHAQKPVCPLILDSVNESGIKMNTNYPTGDASILKNNQGVVVSLDAFPGRVAIAGWKLLTGTSK